MFSIEFFAYTPAPEWNGKKVRIPLEDDAIVTRAERKQRTRNHLLESALRLQLMNPLKRPSTN